MKNINRTTLVLILMIFVPTVSMASGRCKVTDPTGTPLNVRDRQKNIIGTLRNGIVVHILEEGFDDRGKPWVLVTAQNGRIGWVYREFISCY
jgi:hypothetical protein